MINHNLINYIMLIAGIFALIASVYPIPYMLCTLWKHRSHRVRMFYLLIWVISALMAFHHIVYFISAIYGYVLPPNFDIFWVLANALVCVMWIPIFLEVRELVKWKLLDYYKPKD